MIILDLYSNAVSYRNYLRPRVKYLSYLRSL